MSKRKLLSALSLLALALTASVATARAQDAGDYFEPANPAYGNCLTRRDGQQICVGELVLDSSNNAGQVLQLFYNGEAQVRYAAGYYAGQVGSVSVEYLSRSIGCWFNVCERNRVVDRAGNFGTVEAVFQNGMTLVCFESGYLAGQRQVVSADSLSQTMGPAPYPQPYPQPYPHPHPYPPGGGGVYVPPPPPGPGHHFPR